MTVCVCARAPGCWCLVRLAIDQAASASASAGDVLQQASLERAHLALLVDYARTLLQAGYHERAIGLLQAAVELNCFTPGTSDSLLACSLC